MTRLMLAGALLIVLSSTALALGPGFAFGVHANFTTSNFPGPSVSGTNQQISSAYGAGWGGGVHVDANLMVFSFRLSGDYLHYSIDQNKFRDSFRPFFANAVNQMSIDGGGLGIITLAINGKMPVLPLPIITPYLTGGIGLAWVNRDQVTTSITGFTGATIPSSSQSGKTSVDVGVGVDVNIGIALFVEAKYAWIFTDGSNSTYVPVTIGVTF
ncbi:MAG TPA: outer membrane beta-barrel protein [Bacteroidota bacterium]